MIPLHLRSPIIREGLMKSLAKLNHKVATKELHLMDLLEIKAESLEHVTSVGAKITYIVSVLNGNLL